jgi:hypothetical protein
MLPQIWIKKFVKGFYSLERPDFHPERFLGLHIMQVLVNALATNNPNLIMAALLHDICKADGAKMVDKGEFVYFSNPYHDVQAYNFIMENTDIQQWIVSMGADIRIVADICKYHMREKNYKNMRPHKQESYLAQTAHIREYLEKFAELDRMI